ncbi:6286_t:CDS:2 [Acaulospora colombiana]|uniref:6286_t:CDS:1 n=1 Tax=Acaulospora colombiana TaxID=27376 RepID=A0ACA9KKR7_9GLOM|nr:6286_t:CDS:2 [Acaulospora colombiana]
MPQGCAFRHLPILERDLQPGRDSSRGNSVNSDTHQFSLRSLLESASAAVSQTSSHNTVISSFNEERVSLPFNFASSSHISSPSNSSSSNPTDELQSQSSGYHPRDEVENDYLRPSDSDSDLRLPKRPRIARLPVTRRPTMRINKKENGVGNSTNGVSPTSNGNLPIATNGKTSEFTKMANNRQQELVRLMVQAMQDMGYRLVNLHQLKFFIAMNIHIAKFREGVLNGDWDLVENLFSTLELDQNKDIIVVQFLIRQQKYLEFLEKREIKLALYTLRSELTPLAFNTERLHILASFMMYSNIEDLKRRAEWDGAFGTSRQKLLLQLQRYISPSIMVPEHRLETLLKQATDSQHDTKILTCGQDNEIRLWSVESGECLKVMKKHTEPVTTCAWLPDGKSFISGSQDKNIYLWVIILIQYNLVLQYDIDARLFK